MTVDDLDKIYLLPTIKCAKIKKIIIYSAVEFNAAPYSPDS